MDILREIVLRWALMFVIVFIVTRIIDYFFPPSVPTSWITMAIGSLLVIILLWFMKRRAK